MPMPKRALWSIGSLEHVSPTAWFRDEYEPARRRDAAGSIPYWANFKYMPGDILIARSGKKLFTARAVDRIESLGMRVFEKVPATLYQHPKWKSRTPPWRDGWPVPLRRVDSLERRQYFEFHTPDRYLCDCIDWDSTEYGTMTRRRWYNNPVWVTGPRLIEPEGGFPLIFEVMGHPGPLLTTEHGRQKLEEAGLQVSFVRPLTIRSVNWQKHAETERAAARRVKSMSVPRNPKATRRKATTKRRNS